MENNIEDADVCIVGASLSGNYLCYLLSKKTKKKRIVVIEEHEEIGLPFQCAGIISKKLSQLIELPNDIVLNRVQVAKIVAPSGKFIRLSGKEQPYIIDRIALDRLFYNKLKKKDNIYFYTGEKFKSFKYIKENQQKYILIETTKRKLKVKMLIGCDGPLSSVGKLLGVRNENLFAAQIRIRHSFDQNEAVMFFDPRWKELFGWIVPEGNDIFRIGLAASNKVSIKFKIFLKKLGIDINKIIDQQGGIIPYGVMNKSAFDNILLLGDSAGQVKATTGGGIVMLLTAAKYAASCIQKCFIINNYSRKIIKKYYERPCLATIGRQLKIHYLIRFVFERFSNEDFENLFRIIKTSNIEHLISLYGDMDFPKRMIIKLLRNFLVLKFLFRFLRNNLSLVIEIVKLLK